ncbi:MAG: hypothetical protein ACXWFW_04355 [Usitatibacter sp.]
MERTRKGFDRRAGREHVIDDGNAQAMQAQIAAKGTAQVAPARTPIQTVQRGRFARSRKAGKRAPRSSTCRHHFCDLERLVESAASQTRRRQRRRDDEVRSRLILDTPRELQRKPTPCCQVARVLEALNQPIDRISIFERGHPIRIPKPWQ